MQPFSSSHKNQEGQRKHRGGSRPNSRLPHKRRRSVGTSTQMATEAQPIELEENAEEVVDLTRESSSDAVVDLTHNDSVVFVREENLRRRSLRSLRSQQHPDSCVLSSSDEDSRGEADVANSLSAFFSTSVDGTASSRTSGTVSCPICMDIYTEILQSGRLIVATKCGHIFCSQCLRDALKNSSACPTCRKKLTHKQYHPIYI